MDCITGTKVIISDTATKRRRVGDLWIARALMLATGAVVGCSERPATNSPQSGLGSYHPLSVQSVGLNLCTSQQNPKLTMRIYLHRSLDDVIDPNKPTKQVKYDTSSENSAAIQAYDLDGSSLQSNTSNDSNINSNIYHSDLTSLDSSLSNGDVVNYRIIIDQKPNGNDHSDNMTFHVEEDSTSHFGIRGVAVADNSDHRFICSDNLSNEAAGGRKAVVASFYIKYLKNGTPTPNGFNIVIDPISGSTQTPILIDPKILNNG